MSVKAKWTDKKIVWMGIALSIAMIWGLAAFLCFIESGSYYTRWEKNKNDYYDSHHRLKVSGAAEWTAVLRQQISSSQIFENPFSSKDKSEWPPRVLKILLPFNLDPVLISFYKDARISPRRHFSSMVFIMVHPENRRHKQFTTLENAGKIIRSFFGEESLFLEGPSEIDLNGQKVVRSLIESKLQKNDSESPMKAEAYLLFDKRQIFGFWYIAPIEDFDSDRDEAMKIIHSIEKREW